MTPAENIFRVRDFAWVGGVSGRVVAVDGPRVTLLCRVPGTRVAERLTFDLTALAGRTVMRERGTQTRPRKFVLNEKREEV